MRLNCKTNTVIIVVIIIIKLLDHAFGKYKCKFCFNIWNVYRWKEHLAYC